MHNKIKLAQLAWSRIGGGEPLLEARLVYILQTARTVARRQQGIPQVRLTMAYPAYIPIGVGYVWAGALFGALLVTDRGLIVTATVLTTPLHLDELLGHIQCDCSTAFGIVCHLICPAKNSNWLTNLGWSHSAEQSDDIGGCMQSTVRTSFFSLTVT